MSDVISAIDKAIAAAQARKAAKESGLSTGVQNTKQPVSRQTRDAEKERVKQEKKIAREVARLAKQEERNSNRVPHMRKVEKAAALLPQLGNVQATFDEITSSFSAAEIAALAAHLQHFNRTKATERALIQPVTQGSRVRIISGDRRFVGLTGEVTKAQRIRCYVAIPGRDKPVYLFTSDVELLAEAQPIAVNG